MAISQNDVISGPTMTRKAGEAIATAGVFVDLDTSDQCNVADSGDTPVGVAMQTAAAGDMVLIALPSARIRMVVDGSGAAIARGDVLKPDGSNTGKGIKAASNTNRYGAQSLEASAVAGQEIEVIVMNGFVTV